MSEGGFLPWKIQKIKTNGPTVDYSDLANPLPDPPIGSKWVQNVQTREWTLVSSSSSSSSVSSVSPNNDDNNNSKDTKSNRGPSSQNDRNELQDVHIAVPVIKSDNSTINISKVSATGGGAAGGGDAQKDDNDDDCEFILHVVQPTDTFQGLCLKYKVKPTVLRRMNRFSGTNLKLAPSTLIIPYAKGQPLPITTPIPETKEQKEKRKINMVMLAFTTPYRSSFRGYDLSPLEARAYLDMNDWDVNLAILDAREDYGWEKREKEVGCSSSTTNHHPIDVGTKNLSSVQNSHDPQNDLDLELIKLL